MKTYQSPVALVPYVVMMGVSETIDILAGNQISLWVLLLFPMCLGAWNLGTRYGLVLAGLGALIVFCDGMALGNPFVETRYFVVSVVSRAIVMLAMVQLTGLLRRREVERVRVDLKRGK